VARATLTPMESVDHINLGIFYGAGLGMPRNVARALRPGRQGPPVRGLIIMQS
jgi:hypothetical protein